jgi:DsbC/DsbD-like thiol-disulfide interchange protein
VPRFRQLIAMKNFISLCLALTALPSAASAAATGWIEEDGARIRLVAGEPAPDASEMRAALIVELKPGWKTYWRDPGDAGVPPQFNLAGGANVTAARLDFPAPDRFEEGAVRSIGYKHPVSFPLTLTLQAPGKPSVIKASAFLGICEEICVPVQVEFSLDVPVAVGSTADQALAQAAFDALPKPANASFGLTSLSYQPKSLDIEIAAPPSAEPPELFVAASGFQFGAPKFTAALKDKIRYSVPILFAPKTVKIEDTHLFYTLKTGGMAVSGEVPARAN